MQNQRLENSHGSQSQPNYRPKAGQMMLLMPLLLFGTLIIGIWIGSAFGDKNLMKIKPSTDDNASKLVSLIDFIEQYYVDTVNKGQLIDDAIESVLQNLDPHSYYLSAEVRQDENERMQGKFEGVGIEFLILRDTLMVVKPLKDGPSEKAGIRAGDRIVKVDDVEISGKDLDSDKAQKLLKGMGGSEVYVTVKRLGNPELLKFEIERGSIPLESVSAAFMYDDSTGYVKVERFAATTYKEFMQATEPLKEKGCKKLILDLRGNGGGLMDQATQIVEEFLTQGKMIVYTEGTHYGKISSVSEKKGKFREMEVIVMIDQNSASASEIVAGALQDWDRSLTVGRRSFGKGLVQHEMDLPDNSALRLTVARYYTPTGRCIQKPYGDSINYSDDFHKRLLSGELTEADSTHFPDSLRYKTPGGRTVYGGGGIMPDVFVPLDSIYFSGLLGEIAYSGVVRDYCFNYLDAHRAELLKYKTSDDFVDNYVVSDAMLNELIVAAEKEKVTVNKSVVKKVSPQLKSRIKAQLARNLFDDTAMHRVLLQTDQDFKKAVQVAGSYTEYAGLIKSAAELN
ncbi:MAG: S41 family peptidase [Flavobacteriales bacterium]